MSKVINAYKPIGLTPLQLVERYKELTGTKEKVSYMGRLDPLAHGIILLLQGDINKQRDQFMSLDKTYTFKVWLGCKTDSYDLLGAPTTNEWENPPDNWQEMINDFIKSHTGSILQSYPPYSSKPVNGHALFWWARNDRLDEIQIPNKVVQIFSFRLLNQLIIPTEIAFGLIKQKIDLVTGDYRQYEIIKAWEETKFPESVKNITELEFEIKCGTGTYVREMVNQLGQFLGCGAVVVEICRTEMGEYSLQDAERIARVK